MKVPVQPTPELRLKAEKDTILSACTGALGDVTLTDSAVIILFAAMMGAGDMFSMLTTAIMPFMNGVLLIPIGFLATKIGIHRIPAEAAQISQISSGLTVLWGRNKCFLNALGFRSSTARCYCRVCCA